MSVIGGSLPQRGPINTINSDILLIHIFLKLFSLLLSIKTFTNNKIPEIINKNSYFIYNFILFL